MLRSHSAKDEIAFAVNIQAVIKQELESEACRVLSGEDDAYAEDAASRIREQFNEWITGLWPGKIALCFHREEPPATAYLQAAVAACHSPYFDCVRESALRYASERRDTSLLEAVNAADKAGLRPSKRSFLLKFCRSSDSQRPSFEKDFANSIPSGWPQRIPEGRRRIFRWRLAWRLEGLLKDGRREENAWDLFAFIEPSNNKDMFWKGEELARFAEAAEKAGVKIHKAPAACIAFFRKGLSRILMDFAGRDVLFSGADDAACKLISQEIARVATPDTAESTRLGSIGRCFRTMRYDKAEDMLSGLTRLFASLKEPLPSPANDPAYLRFLEERALKKELSSNWWMPLGQTPPMTVPNFKPEALAALRLFGKGLPPVYGKGAGALACWFLESGCLAGIPKAFRKGLSLAFSAEDKARVIFAAPRSWRKFVSDTDPFFAKADWRVLLKAGKRDFRVRIRERLAAEKDAGVYLRFAIEHLPAGERGLGWLGDNGLAQRFIGDFKGTELWKRAGGAALEDESLEALCRAWGSAPEGDPIEKEAGRLIALGVEDDRLLGFMVTKAGLERCGGGLFQALLKANRFFDTDVLGPEAGLRALEQYQKSPDLHTSRKATGLILQKFPEAQALERAHELLAKDACWIEGPLRSEAELPILFGEYRRDPMGLAEALSKLKFPEARVKEKLLAYVKELQAAKAPYMVQASFGLFAGLWPDPNAKLVKWLVAAADWKEKPGHRLEKAYRVFNIPKKSGGKRKISAPIVALKRLQHSVLCDLIDPLGAHPAAMGFVKGCSILTNASVHAGQPVVAVTDVHNCFPSVKWPVLYRVLERDLGEKLGLPAAALVADLCTLDGGLPMGSPASPALLNRVLLKADEILAAEAEKRGCRYTRYADDLTFSGDDRAVELVGRAKSVLAKAGLEIDPKKTNIFRRGRRQRVTGLVVNEKAGVPRHYRRLVRAAADKFCRGGTPLWEGREMSVEELRGRIAFVAGVHPQEGAALLAKVAGEVARRRSEDAAAHEVKAEAEEKRA